MQLDKLQEYFSNVYVKEEIDMEFGDEDIDTELHSNTEEEIEPSKEQGLDNSIDKMENIKPNT